ncbi:MAG: GIY-YIG nuclease family protein [Chloroflexi bacterium]|nr:GIY-YIG nuclease family protein [Chloroflexota bacterium]
MFYVYVLESKKSARRYIGSTQNIETRLTQHNAGYSKSTRSHRPWKLIHFEQFGTRSEAVIREKLLKSWKSREFLNSQLRPTAGKSVPMQSGR